jgi:hypothetical protein
MLDPGTKTAPGRVRFHHVYRKKMRTYLDPDISIRRKILHSLPDQEFLPQAFFCHYYFDASDSLLFSDRELLFDPVIIQSRNSKIPVCLKRETEFADRFC